MKRQIKVLHQSRKLTILTVVLFMLIIVLEIILYLNLRWLSLAREEIVNDQVRLKTLNRAQKLLPLNDEVHLELGKWWLIQAQRPQVSYEDRVEGLRKAMNYLVQAIRLNPGSYQAHFYLAQVGQILRFEQEIAFNPIEEFKKAASLTTYNEGVYYQAGRILFSLWKELSAGDKDLTLQLLANVITPNNPERLEEILPIWEYNGGSEEVLNRILPRDARMYRVVADYLARRGIKHKLRLIKLAQAEKMEFDRARRLYYQALNLAKLSKFKRAEQAFKEAHGLFQRIRFYQTLIDEKLIEEEDYANLVRELKRNIAFLRLSRGEDLSSVRTFLQSYVSDENDVTALEDFIEYLHQRMTIQGSRISSEENFLMFYFEALIDYKKGAYSQLIEKIRTQEIFLQDNTENFPEEVADLWQMMAESYLNLDFVYDALEYYERALVVKPKDIPILLGLTRVYERLNREDKREEVNLLISQIIKEREENFKPVNLLPGKVNNFQVVASGTSGYLKIVFELAESKIKPLVGIAVNNRVISEGFMEVPEIELEANFKVGSNQVEITSYNMGIRCLKIRFIAKMDS